MSELRIKRYLAGFAQVQQRQLVEYIGKPLTFPLIRHIDPPKCIFDRLVTHRRFSGQRHFRHMHDSST